MRIVLFLCLLASGQLLYSQSIPSFKFGKISESDFRPQFSALDTGAAAVVLADVGNTQVKGTRKGWFSLEFKRLRRILILNQQGFKYGEVSIPLYTDGEDEEKLDDLRAVTYNLENGKIKETRLDVKSAVFRDVLSKNRVVKKFALPDLKPGSIIEYEYTVTSDFLFNLQPWRFQGAIPVLWSQYTVALPSFLNYMMISTGNLIFEVKDAKDKKGSYDVEVPKQGAYGETLEKDRLTINCGITEFRWAMKEVKPFKAENFITTPDNYIAGMEFQLAGYNEPLVEQKIMTTWPDMMDRLLKRDDFGKELAADAYEFWAPDLLEKILNGKETQTEKAEKIFRFVRDQFTCTQSFQLTTDQSLKKTADKKSGGVAELNLLLTVLLRAAGFVADPVILSTRDNGLAHKNYPVLGRYNYVISRLNMNGKNILLDASQPLGFGKLAPQCYNGDARVVNGEATVITLNPDELVENRSSVINFVLQADGTITGTCNRLCGYYESMQIRDKIRSKGLDEYKKELKNEYSADAEISSLVVDSLQVTEAPVRMRYTIRFPGETGDLLYIDPLPGKTKDNPFKAADRTLPVEMPYRISDQMSLNFEWPSGYKPDEIPKPLKLKLNENGDMQYSYTVTPEGEKIQIRTVLETKRTYFNADEYDMLREFYNQVIARQNQQIVLRRK